MAKNLLVINVDLRETRVALIEEGIIAELHVERASTRSTLGNIVLGKVTRVLPGMQAAFIDIGQERAAFLHVEDLIRPDDFEAYLTGGKRPEEDDSSAEEPADAGEPKRRVESIGTNTELAAQAPAESTGPIEAEGAHAVDDAIDTADSDDEAFTAGDDAADDADTDSDTDEDDDEPSEADADDDEGDDDAFGEPIGDNGEREESADAVGDDASDAAQPPLAGGFVEGAEVPIAAAPAAASGGFAGGAEQVVVEPPSGESSNRPAPSEPRRRDDRGRQGGKRGEKDKKDQGDGRTFRSKRSARMRGGSKRNGRGRDGKPGRGGGGGGGGRNAQRDASRLSRSTPIREVVREGQEVIVQVSKEPIGTKGARVTSHISLPGRYVVYMPTIEQIGISKRIGSDKERARLREAIESLKPPSGGLIVRTVAEGLTKKQLKADVGYLVRLWEEVARKRDSGGKAPTPLYQELDLVLKTARDLFTDDIAQIVIDDREQYHRLVRFVEMFMPERAKDIVLYGGDEPIFDAYGICLLYTSPSPRDS